MTTFARALTSEEESELSIWRASLVKRAHFLSPLLYSVHYAAVGHSGSYGVGDPSGRIYLDVDRLSDETLSDADRGEILGMLAFEVLLDHPAGAARRMRKDRRLAVDLWRMASEAIVTSELAHLKMLVPSKLSTTFDQLGVDPERGAQMSIDEVYDDLVSRADGNGMTHLFTGESYTDEEAIRSTGIDGSVSTDDLPAFLRLSDEERLSSDFLHPTYADLDLVAPPVYDYVIDSFRTTIADHFADSYKGRGSFPSRMVRWAQKVNAPSVIPWQSLLAPYIVQSLDKKAGGVDSSYSVVSRRQYARVTMPDGSRSRKLTMPGRFAPDPALVIIRDSSGSVSSSELGEGIRETFAIAEKCGIDPSRISILDADASVYHHGSLADGEMEKISGGGGTDMRVPLAALSELPKAAWPVLAIVVTDGGTPWPESPTPFPLLVLTTSSGRATGPSWAINVSMNGIVTR